MKQQNFANHAQLVTGYHFVLFGLMVVTLLGASVSLYRALSSGTAALQATLLVLLSVCLILAAYYARVFALKAQDRAIRAEENLRHFVLTGTLLDHKLHTRQIVGLRFAADEEFAALAARAAAEGLSSKQIKSEIKHWKADHYRV